MGRYDRNRLYITDEEQQKVRETRILFGGVGIGSVIAECALRFGFERMTIVDGRKVKECDLNCQNYSASDIGKYKAEALCKRLLKINPQAEISCRKEFIGRDNVHDIIDGHDIAVNVLDFQSDIPFIFDRICSEKNIPVLHPYNLGWAGFLTIVRPGCYRIEEISEEFQGFELRVAEFVIRYNSFWNMGQEWLKDVIDRYKKENEALSLPQLSVASWLVAGQCVNAMFNIANGRKIQYFPKFYMTSIYDA